MDLGFFDSLNTYRNLLENSIITFIGVINCFMLFVKATKCRNALSFSIRQNFVFFAQIFLF